MRKSYLNKSKKKIFSSKIFAKLINKLKIYLLVMLMALSNVQPNYH
jgi:hypothetical protein